MVANKEPRGWKDALNTVKKRADENTSRLVMMEVIVEILLDKKTITEQEIKDKLDAIKESISRKSRGEDSG